MASAGYVLADRSARLGPAQWARLAVTAYHEFRADRIVAERSFGGAMVESQKGLHHVAVLLANSPGHHRHAAGRDPPR